MYEFFTKLLNMGLTAGILVCVIIVLRLCLKKAPKKYICILWALVALRLICPIGISSSLSLFNWINIGTNASGQINYFQYNGETEKPTLDFDVPSLVDDNLSTDSMTVGNHTSGLYLPTVMYIWLFGAVVMLTYAVISYLQLLKQVSASIQRNDNVYVCDDIKSTFILGIIKPRIFLPSGMKEHTEKNVIAHELAHLKRHDHLWKPFGYILLSVYWFNPILWIAYILLCKDIEAACDEKVIAEMDKDSIAGYSEALLACATHRRMISACPIAFGEIDVKGRVRNVLNYKKPAFWIIGITIIICIIATVCLMTNSKKATQYTIRIVIPANSEEQFYYSEEEISPARNKFTITLGDGYEDTDILFLTVDVKTETAYEPFYLRSKLPSEVEAKKGGWFKLGVMMENPTDEDKEVYLTVENIAVRTADIATETPSIRVMRATITEIANGSMLVTPIEGSWESNSSDVFRVPIKNMEPSPEPQVGDVIEVLYGGGIAEIDPAELENIIQIRVEEQKNDSSLICPVVIAVYESNTDSESILDDEFTIFETFYEMSDGTWRTDTCSYQYRLEITGRSGGAVKDTTYLYLSNIEDISFYQAMMASGFSSNMEDYFDEKDAKFIGFK